MMAERSFLLLLIVAMALSQILCGVAAIGQLPQSSAMPVRQTLTLDQGWRFHLGDIPISSFPGGQGISIYGPDITHSGGKTGYTWGAAARGYNDKTWREVDLPHDWVVEQPFDKSALRAQGYRQRGIGWYRRTFKLDPSDRGKNIELQFDGVATHCTVYFNGAAVHRNWCGYTSFYIDVSSLARYGDDLNTIAVRVDADATEGWWYEGGGIYRHTWLVKRSPLHIITDGVYANPIKSSSGTWTIPAEITISNTGSRDSMATVEIGLFDSSGQKVAGAVSSPASIKSLGQTVITVSLPVEAPRLWSVDEPNLYEVRTTLLSDDQPVDSVITQCGFRTIRFDAKQGFLLNDQPVKLQGTCNHQDHAGVGVAVPDAIWAFRIRKLKEMGSNAYRTAHNPPAKELLDACDSMGMLVMAENRHFNPSPEYVRQLEWLVRRDRNRPSVILWSLFNEEGLERFEEGKEIARLLDAKVKNLDVTRPTTGGQDKGQIDSEGKANPNNAAMSLDVVGINYQASDYAKIRAAYPDKPIVSTEDTSQVMTRGEYANDPSKCIVGSYDDVFWGWQATSSARKAWSAITSQPSFAGGFSWTGFAYRGEPSPYGWPSAGSHFGAMDLCGFPKTEFYVRQALWTKDKPFLAIVPHWNWSDKEGQPIRVIALTNADSVALSINGRALEEQQVNGNDMVEWKVPYEPGRLEATAKKDGKVIASQIVETTGPATQVQLVPDRTAISADGKDVAIFTVSASDAHGRSVPIAQNKIHFNIKGQGKIIGVGNGDPNSHELETIAPIIQVIPITEWRWKTGEFSSSSIERSPDFADGMDDSSWSLLKSDEYPLKENTTGIFRSHVTLSQEDIDGDQIHLSFGKIDDHGWIVVNNHLVGESHGVHQSPVIEIKKYLRAGKNTIAVGVKNDGGPGGVEPLVNIVLRKSTAQGWSRKLYNGLAQIIVQSTRQTGSFVLTANSEGLNSAAVTVQTTKTTLTPSVP